MKKFKIDKDKKLKDQYNFLIQISNYLDNIALEQNINKRMLEELKIDQKNILIKLDEINNNINS